MKQLRSQFNTRQYMLSEDYEVYYYSDLHFKSVGAHSHNYYEFYFFVEGDVTMEVAGKKLHMAPGQLLVVPPKTIHRALVRDSSKPYRRFVLWLSQKYCRALDEVYRYAVDKAQAEGYLLKSLSSTQFSTLTGRLFALLDEINSARYGREEAVTLLISDLLLRISRTLFDKGAAPAPAPSVYEAVTDYIDTHLDEDLSLDALSRRFYVSKYHISHVFTEKTGLSVHRYIVKKRLEAAHAALRGGTAPSQAAAMYGFRDYSSFYRAFSREYGVAPSVLK